MVFKTKNGSQRTKTYLAICNRCCVSIVVAFGSRRIRRRTSLFAIVLAFCQWRVMRQSLHSLSSQNLYDEQPQNRTHCWISDEELLVTVHKMILLTLVRWYFYVMLMRAAKDVGWRVMIIYSIYIYIPKFMMSNVIGSPLLRRGPRFDTGTVGCRVVRYVG